MILIMFSFLLMVIFSIPIAISMLISTIIYLIWIEPIDLVVIPQMMENGLDSFPLLAVPFFLLLGQLMEHTGVTERFIALARAMVGHIRGGLAHINIVASMLMAGIQGSATADTAALGSIIIPPMIKDGYSRAFSAVVTASSSTIGPIIPPSVIMVVYAAIGNVSVGRLFLAGAIPGGIMGVYLIITTYIIARKRGYGVVTDGLRFKNLYIAAVGAIWPLLLPGIIIGGILGGVFTATESGAVALLYLLVAASVHLGGMRLSIKGFITAVRESVYIIGAVMFIVAAASVFGWMLNAIKVGDAMCSFFLSISENPIIVLLMLNVLFLILGCFIETMALLILLTPILVPVITNIGIDPIHFGIIMILNLMIGLMTPPVGICMYVTSTLAKCNIEDFTKESWPFLLALLLVLLMIVFIPGITMYLPNLLLPLK